MKIRKYFAPDIRQAINMAREEHGEDVVILSNRKVLGGVELVAAEDYDDRLFDNSIQSRSSDTNLEAGGDDTGDASEVSAPVEDGTNSPGRKDAKHQVNGEPALDEVRKEINSLRDLLENQMSGLAWGEVGRQHPLWAGLVRKLGNMGVNPSLSRQLVQQIPENYPFDQAWRTTLALLSYRIPVEKKEVLEPGNVLALLGATGSGKTTTIAKMATQCVLKHGPDSVVVASTDSYRVGGKEQLRSYARILGIPMRTIHNKSELVDLLDQFQGRKLVLVDTAGLSPVDVRHKEQLAILKPLQARMNSCLVLPAIAQMPALEQITRLYSPLRPGSCVITKLDEASSIGGVISVAVQKKLKVIFQSDGQQVPEDLHRGDAARLTARAVSVMNRHSIEQEDVLFEQHYGNHVVYNPMGDSYEH